MANLAQSFHPKAPPTALPFAQTQTQTPNRHQSVLNHPMPLLSAKCQKILTLSTILRFLPTQNQSENKDPLNNRLVIILEI